MLGLSIAAALSAAHGEKHLGSDSLIEARLALERVYVLRRLTQSAGRHRAQ